MESKLFLNDLLRLPDQELANTKVRFNVPAPNANPIDVFKRNPEEINSDWFLHRNKNNVFDVGQIGICLVRISGDRWLFTTVKTITADNGKHGDVAYEAREWEQFCGLYGRVIVKFHKTFQVPAVNAISVMPQLEVLEVLPDLFDDDGFPGYDKVCLSYERLHRILDRGLRDWTSALENQKGVYVITDTASGKLYVGSATAENGMLLKRWSDYIYNGHGEDVALKEVVEELGFDYIKQNFQYTLLENYNSRIDDHVILSRESWWKNALGSREFGYNRN
jgi:hypothetical protein